MRLTKILFSLLFLLSCQHKTPTEQGEENSLPQWAMFGGNLRNTANAADEIDYYEGPEVGQVIWNWSPPNRLEVIYTTPSIGSDGTIYLPTTPISSDADTVGHIYAVTPSGQMKWQFETERGNFSGGALGLDDTYYVASRDGYFYAIGENGNLLWRWFWGRQSVQRPAINKAGNIVASSGTSIQMLDGDSGEELWEYQTISSGDITIDAEDNIYIGTLDGLLSLTSQGGYRWHFPARTGPLGIAISHNGTILFTVRSDSLLYALSESGELQWTFNLSGTTLLNVPAITKTNEIVVLRSDDVPQQLFRIDSDGQLLLSINIPDLTEKNFVYLDGISPVVDSNGIIYLGANLTEGDDFFTINPDGKVKWSLDLGDTRLSPITGNPVLSLDGSLYLTTERSLMAIR